MAGPVPGSLVVEVMPWVALLASLLMLGGAWVGLNTVRDLLLDGLRTEARVIAQGMAGQVQQVLRSADSTLSLLQSSLLPQDPPPDDAALRRMMGCCEMLPGGLGVFLRDPQGTVIASTLRNPDLERALGTLPPPQAPSPVPPAAGSRASPSLPPQALSAAGGPSRLIPVPPDRPPHSLVLLRPPSAPGQYGAGMILRAATLLESFDGLLALHPSAVRLQQQGPIQAVLAQRGNPDLLKRITGTRDTPASGPAGWSGQDWLTATSPVPPFAVNVTVSLSAAETMRRWWEISLACLAALLALAVAMTGISLALRRHGRARAATVQRLVEAEQDLHLAHAVARIGEFSLDLATRRITWSDGVHRLFRTDPRQPVRPLSWILDHLDPEGRKDVRQVWRRLLAEPERNLRSERRIRRADGTTAWCWIEFRLQRDAQGRPAAIRGVLQDITREREAEEQVRRLAEKDSLTGLANRWRLQKHLEESLDAARETGQRVGVLYLDLDGFKSINDRWGHRAGDQLLLQVAERIQGAVRPGDLVARLGGDEFVVVQSGLPEDAARAAETIQRLATRLVTLLRRSYDLGDGREGIVSASAGLALFPTDAADASALLECADTALYRTKLAGRNGWSSFSFEMDREIRDARSLEQDLRQAVPQGQLELAWQPQAALGPPGETSGEAEAPPRIVGFEALLRWRHPERGLLSPDVFIPSAERSGTILEIGEWVLRTACAEAARWSRPLRLAVNVSPVQVQQGDLVAVVHRALRDAGLPPERLELEVTEGLLLRDVGQVQATLSALREMGVGITLDDFGTGYSSLMTLRAFPFGRLKLDRGFIATMTEDTTSAAIVRGTLALARSLGLPVTAEGVETEEQARALRAEGCDEIQGWLIGRPLPIERWRSLTGDGPGAPDEDPGAPGDPDDTAPR
ncbi:putative bifunctional diguanylate cyclase/phosphodiesterase [Roseomonas gilardii]|uniref:putative bifunctional diguanylate cyclase/phosphodiesterase n=1 Tax=Roseomonas gilardii TaxID=257708 RepID=UPI0004B0F136|nr:EAL domain-containing protein [Roseomonas gilardii]SUE43542.1 Cyclic di-GMP phosphodiesterase Gmr [Roseomonas gilardii subsp. rosea]